MHVTNVYKAITMPNSMTSLVESDATTISRRQIVSRIETTATCCEYQSSGVATAKQEDLVRLCKTKQINLECTRRDKICMKLQRLSDARFRLKDVLVGLLFCQMIVGTTSAYSSETANKASWLLNAGILPRRAFEVGGFFDDYDAESCWQNLQAADVADSIGGAEPDGFVDRSEYVQFAKAATPPGIISPDLINFDELPEAFQVAYSIAACLCANPDFGGNITNETCCYGLDGKIRVPASPANASSVSQTDAAYLYVTCIATSEAAQTVLTSPSPSVSPSLQPTSSYKPSMDPTINPSAIKSPTYTSASATVIFQISIRNGKVLLDDQTFQTEYLSNVQVGLNRLAESIAPSSNEISETIVTGVTTTSKDGDIRRTEHGFDGPLTRKLQSSPVSADSSILLQLPTILGNVTNTTCPGNGGPLVSNVGEKDAISLNLTSDVCQTIAAVVELLVVSTSDGDDLLAPALKFETDLYNAIYDGLYQRQLDSIYRDQGELSSPIIVLTGYIPEMQSVPAGGPMPTVPSVSPPNDQVAPTNSISPVESGDGSLSPLSLSAIVIGASAFALLPIILFLSNRMKKKNDDDYDDEYDDEEIGQRKPPDYQEYRPDADADVFSDGGQKHADGKFRLPGDSSSLASNSQYTDSAIKSVGSVGPSRGAVAVGAGAGGVFAAASASATTKKSAIKNNNYPPFEYGKGGHGSKKVMEAMVFVDEDDNIATEPGPKGNADKNRDYGVGNVGGVGLLLAADSRDRHNKHGTGGKDDDGSSNAGSSGWSSSAGISSLNTGSIDDSADIAAAAGATLAGIGLASATYRKNQQQQQQRQTRRNVNVSKLSSDDEHASNSKSITTDEEDDVFRSGNSNKSSESIVTVDVDIESDDDDDEIAKNVSDHSGAFGTHVQSKENVGQAGEATRDHLDTLIESGDWAAVGATAALLAAASDSQSASTRNTGAGNKSIGSRGSFVDAAKAAELDHLVDAGDWEGVVKAAAKYEASSAIPVRSTTPVAVVASTAIGTGDMGFGSSSGGSSRDSRSRTISSQDSSGGSADGTGTFTGTFDPTLSTTASEDPSRQAKLAECRAEVEALVRRVVPEEIDNVDEMMNQFKGREEELIETLRTMQERAVAQKARQAGQKNAKLDARRNVQRGVVPGTSNVAQRVATFETIEAKSPPVQSAEIEGSQMIAQPVDFGVPGVASGPQFGKFDGSVGSTELARNQRLALDAAIEAGDWGAVRDTAAAFSVSSVASSTMASSEVERLANANISTTSSEGTGSRRKRSNAVDAERATELDSLIDREDWDAVVNMATRFINEDKYPVTKSFNDVVGQLPSLSKISKEEEEALREAELWMKIAEQKKAEGNLDTGASEAAEWAIQRSLSQLREAEKRIQSQQTKTNKADEDEV